MIRSPSDARRQARAAAADQNDPLGARKGAQLNRWAEAVKRARAINEQANPDDADRAWATVEDSRLLLADYGLEAAGENDLRKASPSHATTAGNPRRAARQDSRGGDGRTRRPGARGRARSSRRGRSPVQRAGSAVLDAVPGGGPGWGDLAMEALAATIALAVLLRLVDTARGGPRVVSLVGSGVSAALQRLVLPVDPLGSLAGAAAPAPAARSGGSSSAAATAHNHPGG